MKKYILHLLLPCTIAAVMLLLSDFSHDCDNDLLSSILMAAETSISFNWCKTFGWIVFDPMKFNLNCGFVIMAMYSGADFPSGSLTSINWPNRLSNAASNALANSKHSNVSVVSMFAYFFNTFCSPNKVGKYKPNVCRFPSNVFSAIATLFMIWKYCCRKLYSSFSKGSMFSFSQAFSSLNRSIDNILPI